MTTLTDLSQLTKSMVKKSVEEPKPAPMPKAEVPTCRPHVCRCGTLAQGVCRSLCQMGGGLRGAGVRGRGRQGRSGDGMTRT